MSRVSSEGIAAIAKYRNDVILSLRLYFSESSPTFSRRFVGYSLPEVAAELKERIDETDRRSSLFLLINLERTFRIDYEYRREKKVKGPLFKAFRDIHKSRKRNVRLSEDIFEGWKESVPGVGPLVEPLRRAFKFRHWLAHGEYWELKGRKYDFDSLYDLAVQVSQAFSFVGIS
jgi:hypothetical protein